MNTIQLTKCQTAKVINSSTVETVTEQSVGGGGARNVIVWALEAATQGYTILLLDAPKAFDWQTRASLKKAIKNANRLLNLHGMAVHLKLPK